MCLLEMVHRARTVPVGGSSSAARAIGTNVVMSGNFVLNLLIIPPSHVVSSQTSELGPFYTKLLFQALPLHLAFLF